MTAGGAVTTGRPVRRVVDLSHPVDEGTQVYPGDPAVSLSPATTIAGEGFNVLHVRMGSQTGTHVDAPYHFLVDGARIDELDLALFCGAAVVVDLRGTTARQAIGWDSLQPYADALAPGRLLVLHTGWDRYWGTDTYFDHPYLDAEAAARVVAAGVRTVALDTLSLDETVLEGPQPAGFAAHHAVLGAGGVIAENLTNIAAVDFPDPVLSILPLRLTGADGAPVRAVAMQLA